MRRIGVALPLIVFTGLYIFFLILPGASFSNVNRIRAVAARAQMEQLLTALNTYRMDVGTFPAEAQGLQALRTNPGVRGWNGPYVQKDIPLDPWGKPYRYTSADGRPHLSTLGGGSP